MTEFNSVDKIQQLCNDVRACCKEHKFRKCITLISQSMSKFPDSATPHNLYGIVLECMGDHVDAMKHFRAAIALDPSDKPSNWNLQLYGTFFSDGEVAFDESDIKVRKLKKKKF